MLVVWPGAQHRERRRVRCVVPQAPHGSLPGARAEAARSDLAKPIKRKPEHALVVPPAGVPQVKVDGRETSYFEWLGAGLYSAERRGGAMHGRAYFLARTALWV